MDFKADISDMQNTDSDESAESSSTASSTTNPSLFNFPILDNNGVPQTRDSPRPRQHTPPAALSSLGAKARMAGRDGNLSESVGSLAESHYDMVDDLSEISNDDHETASIISAEPEDGQLTPEEATDAVEEEEPSDITSITPGASDNHASLPPHQIQDRAMPNEVLDSFLSEDIDTPRQSVMPISFSSTLNRSEIQLPKRTTLDQLLAGEHPQGVKRILVFAPEGVRSDVLDRITCKIGEGLCDSFLASQGGLKVVRLPETPSGIVLHYGTIISADGSVLATVQRCTALEQSPSRESFYVMEGSIVRGDSITSFATLNMSNPKDSDFVVVYLGESGASEKWLSPVYKTIQDLARPTLFVCGHTVVDWRLSLFRDNSTVRPLHHVRESVLLGMDDADLGDLIRIVLDHPPRSPQSFRKARASPIINLGALLILSFLSAYIITLFLSPTSYMEPQVLTSMRRDALAHSATRFFNSSHDFNNATLDHLLPMKDCHRSASSEGAVDLQECFSEVRYQALDQNHIIISLPGAAHFPEITFLEVYKDQGKTQLKYNKTQLIDGVFDIAVDPDEAFNLVNVHMFTKTPSLNITVSHNFGNRLLHLKTYEQASKDVGKALTKDMIVIRHTARTLSDQLSMRWKTKISGARNATNRLSREITRNLQAYASTAVNRASNLSFQTLQSLNTDLVVVHKDLVKFSTDLSTSLMKSVQAVQSHTKQQFHERLEAARKRSVKIRNALSAYTKTDARKTTRMDESAKQMKSFSKDLAQRFEEAFVSTMPDAVRNKKTHKQAAPAEHNDLA